MRLVEVRWVPVAALVLSIAGCESRFVACSPASLALTPGETNQIDFSCDELDEVGNFKDDILDEDIENTTLSGVPAWWSSEATITTAGRRVEIAVPSWVAEGTTVEVRYIVGVLFDGAPVTSSEAIAKFVVGPPRGQPRHLVSLSRAPQVDVVSMADGQIPCNGACEFGVVDGDGLSLSVPGQQSCGWVCRVDELVQPTRLTGCDVQLVVTRPLNCEFDPTPDVPNVALLLQTSGAGRIEGTAPGITNPCSRTQCDVDPGTVLTLKALPNSGSSFVGWSGACAGTDQTTEVRVDQDGDQCTATFETTVEMAHLEVQLDSNSADYATVVAEGAQISCPGDCEAEVAPNSPVTLRVVRKAEINDQLEITWGGACEGSAETAQVTVDSDKMCTVTVTPRDACAGAVAPSMLALDVWHNGAPLVVDRSSGIAVVQIPRTARLVLDASGTQVSSGLIPTFNWNIGGQNLGQNPTMEWSPGDAPSNTSITGILRFDDGCTGEQTLDMRFDIGF